MYFLWVQCENFGKGYYLSQANNWSSRLEIIQQTANIGEKIELPVVVTNGVYSVDLPEGFYWVDGISGSRNLEHCSRLSMRNVNMQLDLYVAKVEKQSTVFKKYMMPVQSLTIGSKADNIPRDVSCTTC